jgi:hypothetical protein
MPDFARAKRNHALKFFALLIILIAACLGIWYYATRPAPLPLGDFKNSGMPPLTVKSKAEAEYSWRKFTGTIVSTIGTPATGDQRPSLKYAALHQFGAHYFGVMVLKKRLGDREFSIYKLDPYKNKWLEGSISIKGSKVTGLAYLGEKWQVPYNVLQLWVTQAEYATNPKPTPYSAVGASTAGFAGSHAPSLQTNQSSHIPAWR